MKRPEAPERLETGLAGMPGAGELLAALPVAVLLVAPDDRVAHVNTAAEQLLNISERVLLGQPLAALVPRDDAPRGQARLVYDTEIVTARGYRMRVDLIEDGVPRRPGWRTVTLHPVQGRGLGQPERSGRAAVGAAAMLAHEIRNPLSGIRGAAQLLGPCELTRLITTEVDRIAGLIDRMQDFGDTRPLPLAAENIYPLLAHARALAEAGFAAGIRIEERYDPSLPAAHVARDALLQVLINLLRNAAAAVQGEEDPTIVLCTAYRHGVTRAGAPGEPRVPLPIEICVIDNGPGAPADIADQLFEPFVSGRPEGQGLGLALVDKLVRDMGGIVQYAREGTPPRTVFRLVLARRDA